MRGNIKLERGNQALANLIKKRRMAFDLSQEEVADSVGMSLRSYQYLEAGKTKITMDKEVRLMRIMRKVYVKKTGFILDEEKDNESIATAIKDLFLRLLKS